MRSDMDKQSKNRPNIVLIMPDQLRADFLGCYGAKFIQTPHIDSLAQQGLQFNRAVSPSPICIPARASLLTGHNALSTGILTNNFWLRPDHEQCGLRSLTSALLQQGYHTEGIGKMHFIPWDQHAGFSHRWIAEDKRHIHIQDDYADYLATHGLRKLAGTEEHNYGDGRMASVSPIPLEHQVDVWVGDRSVEFLDDFSQDKPFFLWVAFPGPHDPYNPPAEILESLPPAEDFPLSISGTVDSQAFQKRFIQAHLTGSAQADFQEFPESAKQTIRRHYAGLVHIIDNQVGRILTAIKQLDTDQETLIFFTSDHGDFLGDFDMVGKALFYDPSSRIPLIAKGEHYQVGQSRSLVSLTDLYATILHHAGVKFTAQDSQSIPTNLNEQTRQTLLGATGAGLMWCDQRWKLSRYKNGLGTLFDLETDPVEQHNRLCDPVVANIREHMDAELTKSLIDGLAQGHQEKSYPYMTLTPEHPSHQKNWRRPYPANTWKRSDEMKANWGKAGMPI
jgi:arylsulfatase A-like enzyme